MQVTKGGLRALARAAEAERHPTPLGPLHVPEAPVAKRTPPYPADSNGYKHYAIPGNSTTPWNWSVHGVQVHEDELGDGVHAEVDWRPGYYSLSTGSGAQSIDLLVPEAVTQADANQNVLLRFHELLCHIHPDG